MEFPTRSDTNKAVQPQKMGYRFEIFGFRKKRDCAIYLGKTKALIVCAVTAQLICAFVFEYAKSRFSHDVAQLLLYPRIISSPEPKAEFNQI